MPTSKNGIRRRRGRRRSTQAGTHGGSVGLKSHDPAGLVRQVRAGFPFSRLAQLQKTVALPWDRIVDLVQIPRRTLARREKEGRLRPDESDRVLRAARLVDMVVDLFEGDLDAARQWLQAPQPGLGGESPLDFAGTEVGAREVERLVARLEHGVFT